MWECMCECRQAYARAAQPELEAAAHGVFYGLENPRDGLRREKDRYVRVEGGSTPANPCVGHTTPGQSVESGRRARM